MKQYKGFTRNDLNALPTEDCFEERRYEELWVVPTNLQHDSGYIGNMVFGVREKTHEIEKISSFADIAQFDTTPACMGMDIIASPRIIRFFFYGSYYYFTTNFYGCSVVKIKIVKGDAE